MLPDLIGLCRAGDLAAALESYAETHGYKKGQRTSSAPTARPPV